MVVSSAFMQWSPLRGSSKQSFNFSKVTEDIA